MNENFSVPIAMIFFNRPDTLQKVFEKVKEVKPSKLFLIQDGPRDNNMEDSQKIQECRQIVSQVDWDCKVYKNYSERNQGCGLRPSSGISWVFENVEEAIFLEDDCVPNKTFFPFCQEMLDRYRDDMRIGIVSGLNYFREYSFSDCSYGFVKSGAIWGWATWRTRWQQYDYTMKAIKDGYILDKLKKDILNSNFAQKRIQTWISAKSKIDNAENVSFWDYQWGFIRHINSWLAIVPKYNQISNIGIGINSTHSGKQLKLLPKSIQQFFFMDTKELEFPLVHPTDRIPDRQYDLNYYRIIYPNLITRFLRIPEKFRIIYYKIKK